jgi:hypothetical protein
MSTTAIRTRPRIVVVVTRPRLMPCGQLQPGQQVFRLAAWRGLTLSRWVLQSSLRS